MRTFVKTSIKRWLELNLIEMKFFLFHQQKYIFFVHLWVRFVHVVVECFFKSSIKLRLRFTNKRLLEVGNISLLKKDQKDDESKLIKRHFDFDNQNRKKLKCYIETSDMA